MWAPVIPAEKLIKLIKNKSTTSKPGDQGPSATPKDFLSQRRTTSIAVATWP